MQLNNNKNSPDKGKSTPIVQANSPIAGAWGTKRLQTSFNQGGSTQWPVAKTTEVQNGVQNGNSPGKTSPNPIPVKKSPDQSRRPFNDSPPNNWQQRNNAQSYEKRSPDFKKNGCKNEGGYPIRKNYQDKPKNDFHQTQQQTCRLEDSKIESEFKGTKGSVIPIISNHFKVQLHPNMMSVYQYHVEISHSEGVDKRGKAMRPLRPESNREILEACLTKLPFFEGVRPAYDGQNILITKRELPIKEEVFFEIDHKLKIRDRESTFAISVKPVKKSGLNNCAISLNSLHGGVQPTCEAIMAMDIILRHCPSLKLLPVGRSLYIKPHPSRVENISGGLTLWNGYHQSMQVGESCALLNIDRKTCAFYSPIPLLDQVYNILSSKYKDPPRDSLQESDIRLLSNEFRNLKIYVKHLAYEKSHSIYNVSMKSARQLEFKEGDRMISVEDYFWNHHKKKLSYPNFPCVNAGNQNNQVYIPFEFCFIKDDQPYKRKLNAIQTTDMIKKSAIPPRERFDEIRNQRNQIASICEPIRKAFGIKINDHPVEFNARKISAPRLGYFKNQVIQPENGTWLLKDYQLFERKNISRWAIVSYANPRFCSLETLESFSGKLQAEAKNLGIEMKQHSIIQQVKRTDSFERIMSDMKKRCGSLDLVLVVLKEDAQYAEIKHVGDVQLGLATQCIKENNLVKKCNSQLLCNLLLKINTKLGGVNSFLMPKDKPDIFRKPVVIFGADVNHPPPGDMVTPSVAAVVGSLDDHPSRYASAVRLQNEENRLKSRLEIIQDLKEMVVDILKARAGVKPDSLVFFRDGVGDGQYDQLLERELPMIRAACHEVYDNYCPKIALIVVLKRHNTRFMPKNHEDGVGKCRNIPPGTTVDTHITKPNTFDYFQCSHFGIQGTSRPTKYTVIHDDIGFTGDEIQKLSHYLCYTYVRCTRSISVPAPVQYAHLAAYRGKDHLSTMDHYRMEDEAMEDCNRHILPRSTTSMYYV